MERAEQSKILCIEHDCATLESLQQQLYSDFEFHGAESGDRALEMIMEYGPYEAVITNPRDSSIDSYAFLDRVKQLSPATVSIMLTGESDIGFAQKAYDSGHVYRYLVKPCSKEELISTINSAVLEKTSTIHKQLLMQEAYDLIEADVDSGTTPMYDAELGIGSSMAMQVELDHMHNVALRYKRPFSIAMFDIDDYEQYAAHYDKKASKLAHKLVAEHMRHCCRVTDRIYRYHSNSTPLLVLLPETSADGAAAMVERAVKSFSSRNIPNSRSEHRLLTISGSVSSYDPAFPSLPTSQELVDEAILYLHVAQASGGNCFSRPGQDGMEMLS